MKNIFMLMIIFLLCNACATPYKAASKPTSNGYFDTILQTGVYDITLTLMEKQKLSRRKILLY